MSLINKMLRDLDARHASDVERSGLPAAVTPLAAQRTGRITRLTVLLGAVLVAVALAAAWYGSQSSIPQVSTKPPFASGPVVVPVPVVPGPPPSDAASAPASVVEAPSGQVAAVTPVVPAGTLPASAPAAPVAPTSAVTAVAPLAPAAPVVPAVPATPPIPAAPVSVAPVAAQPAKAAAAAPGANLGVPSLRMADELSIPVSAAAPPRKAAAPKPAKPVAAPKPVEQPVAATVPTRPPVVALPREPPVAGEGRIDKQSRLPPPAERAELEYKRGILAQRQGNLDEAAGRYRAALEAYPEHAAARQTLAGMLIDAKHFDDAEELLRKGTELAAVRLASTLALARLKVERNQSPAALDLLVRNAASGERSAEYQGFAAALLNRAGRAAEAVERYQAATRLAPNEGRWWAGLGIALEAAGKAAEAREAYQKARSLPGLPADLAQHIEQRLR